MEVGKYLRRKVIDRELWWEETQRTKYGGIWVQQKKVWSSKYLKRRAHKRHKLEFFLHKYPCDKSWSLWSVLCSVLTHFLLPEGMCLENIQVGKKLAVIINGIVTLLELVLWLALYAYHLTNLTYIALMIVFGRGLLMAPSHFPFFPKPLNFGPICSLYENCLLCASPPILGTKGP